MAFHGRHYACFVSRPTGLAGRPVLFVRIPDGVSRGMDMMMLRLRNI
jgi:hypothetical protein